MAWRIYSQTVLFLKRIREQFRNLLHQPRQYSRLLHRYQYRISRTLWLIKLTLLPLPDTAGQEPGQGVEEVPNTGTVDYTVLLEQLIQQNEKQQELMETLVRENKKLEQDMKNIQNAMPAMMCMLGVIIGVLLLHILASYIRP